MKPWLAIICAAGVSLGAYLALIDARRHWRGGRPGLAAYELFVAALATYVVWEVLRWMVAQW